MLLIPLKFTIIIYLFKVYYYNLFHLLFVFLSYSSLPFSSRFIPLFLLFFSNLLYPLSLLSSSFL